MRGELFLTSDALIELQRYDLADYWEKRLQNFSEAPLSDLLAIVDIRRRMLDRNAKLSDLEKVYPDVPL